MIYVWKVKYHYICREGVRNFFLVGRSEADITKNFVYLRKYKFLPFVRQIFGGAVAHPAPPLTPSLILSIYFEKKQEMLDFPGSLVVRALDCGPKGRRFEPDPGRNGFFILRGLVLRSYSGLPTTPARWRWERCRNAYSTLYFILKSFLCLE